MQETYLGKAINFASPAGEPALLAPDSVQWRIYKNQIALGIGGIAAVLLEFAEPRIRSGVWDHSTYKADPIGRSRRTGTVALLACYGPASLAKQVIAGVTRMHARVTGETPAGEAYKALDPVLLDWVAATAAYGFLTAYDRFVAPLPQADQDRFLRDSEAVGSQFGARRTPQSVDDFMAMLEELEPRFEPHPILFEFLDIIESGTAAPSIPRFLHRAVARAAVSLLPPRVRARLELGSHYDLRLTDRLALKLAGRMADRKFDPASPPAQACTRLGLPADFLYRPQAEQQRLLAGISQAA
ncbi:oxygenase MpaB family protein [Novosphingobium sp.]|uniref:oxygenase MpaB family protein n=1 Tax=Novosphingobium sp. TaxID=1874826 RepID=UPI001ECC9917|nr:oxygenase MpaB family protein [Novosphingobium sp.]MBK6800602.1 DUF2236 domain-containing protein [Novosphingobium sp.]MBK9011158.1 DUF2236 domain-containing protein [Novosphingobium sp.]